MNNERKGRNWLQMASFLVIAVLTISDLFLIQQNRKLKAALSPSPREVLKPGDRVKPVRVEAIDGDTTRLDFSD